MFFISGASPDPSVTICLEIYITAIRILRVHRLKKINHAAGKWHVEGHVRKLAFCGKTQPVWLGFALRVVGKIKRILLPPGERQAAGLMGAG
jgi:hypothetical protein